MTDERWARIKSVVADAMDHPTAERAAYVDHTCGEDPQLRAAAKRAALRAVPWARTGPPLYVLMQTFLI